MESRPPVQYAASDGLDIAFAVSGQGPPDVVLVPGFMSHLDLDWVHQEAVFRRLGSFARLIRFDKRGVGLSDRSVPVGSLEARMDDVRAVMDVAGSTAATLIGLSEGGPMSIMLAATYPERVRSLVLWGSFARRAWAPDYPDGTTDEAFRANRALMASMWGKGYSAHVLGGPGVDAELVSASAAFERATITPSGAVRMTDIVHEIDVRGICGVVRVPTLVIQRRGDPVSKCSAGRDLASRIPGARYAELPGDFHVAIPAAGQSDDDALDLIEEFITGDIALHGTDRVLASVLFTDIVDSTKAAARMGDERWRRLLDQHDALVQSAVSRGRGRVVKFTGDGTLALFDGPARAVRVARAIGEHVKRLGISVRAGVHVGEIEQRGDDVAGIAVHIAARIAARARADEILVSRTVRDLVAGSGLEFSDRGEHELKGIPEPWQLLAVSAVPPDDVMG